MTNDEIRMTNGGAFANSFVIRASSFIRRRGFHAARRQTTLLPIANGRRQRGAKLFAPHLSSSPAFPAHTRTLPCQPSPACP